MKPVLFLPSWYPSRLDPFTGDFIQRHAKALSLLMPVHVVFFVRDQYNVVTDSIKIERSKDGNLAETTIYYACKNYKLNLVDKFVAMRRYRSVYRHYFLNSDPGSFLAAHVHVPYKAGLIALWLKKKFNLPYYVTEHWVGYDWTNSDNFFSRPPAFRYITKKVLRNAKIVTSVSEDLSNKLKSIVQGIKTRVIPNVVNDQVFYPLQDRPAVFRFVHYVSSWKGQKNTEGIIRVLSTLQKERSDWECIMYGPAGNELRELVNKLGLQQNIKFTGEVSNEMVAEIVRSASLFISFSNYENQPCSILESLCCGIPVIATRVGGIPEVIGPQNGILVEPGNEAQLFEGIKKMMERFDEYDRETIANDARMKFGSHTVGRQLHSLYHS